MGQGPFGRSMGPIWPSSLLRHRSQKRPLCYKHRPFCSKILYYIGRFSPTLDVFDNVLKGEGGRTANPDNFWFKNSERTSETCTYYVVTGIQIMKSRSDRWMTKSSTDSRLCINRNSFLDLSGREKSTDIISGIFLS